MATDWLHVIAAFAVVVIPLLLGRFLVGRGEPDSEQEVGEKAPRQPKSSACPPPPPPSEL